MQTIEIAKATVEQLRAYAESVMGLDLSGSETRAQLRALIAAGGHEGETIAVPEPASLEAAVRAAPRAQGQRRTNARGEEEVLILVHTNDGPHGERPVFVACNGRRMGIPRGEEVWVPQPFVNALSDAEMMVYAKVDRGLGEGRLVKRFPFSYV